jgi:hypothetical protein
MGQVRCLRCPRTLLLGTTRTIPGGVGKLIMFGLLRLKLERLSGSWRLDAEGEELELNSLLAYHLLSCSLR